MFDGGDTIGGVTAISAMSDGCAAAHDIHEFLSKKRSHG